MTKPDVHPHYNWDDEPERQPREHSVLCVRCLKAQTWELDAVCQNCKPVLRRSSVYEVRTEDGDSQLLNAMIGRCRTTGAKIAGTGIDPGGIVFIRIRVANDTEALEAALTICDGRTFSLVTGYGINRRELSLLRLTGNSEPAP